MDRTAANNKIAADLASQEVRMSDLIAPQNYEDAAKRYQKSRTTIEYARIVYTLP